MHQSLPPVAQKRSSKTLTDEEKILKMVKGMSESDKNELVRELTRGSSSKRSIRTSSESKIVSPAGMEVLVKEGSQRRLNLSSHDVDTPKTPKTPKTPSKHEKRAASFTSPQKNLLGSLFKRNSLEAIPKGSYRENQDF